MTSENINSTEVYSANYDDEELIFVCMFDY